jgi:hypothetical protein
MKPSKSNPISTIFPKFIFFLISCSPFSDLPVNLSFYEKTGIVPDPPDDSVIFYSRGDPDRKTDAAVWQKKSVSKKNYLSHCAVYRGRNRDHYTTRNRYVFTPNPDFLKKQDKNEKKRVVRTGHAVKLFFGGATIMGVSIIMGLCHFMESCHNGS